MKKLRVVKLVICMVVGAVLFTAPMGSLSHAQTFTTPAGSQINGLDVKAQAAFTIDDATDTISIILTNLQANPTAVAQNLSDLGFILSSGQTSGTLSSSSGMERTVASDGTFTDGSIVATGWALTNNFSFGSAGTGLELSVLGTPAGPAHTIIGPPDNTGIYSNANNSIAGNGPHNPFLGQTATFTLSVPGIDTTTAISFVQFSFNTAPGSIVNVPEPSTLLLLGCGLFGFVGLRRKIRK